MCICDFRGIKRKIQLKFDFEIKITESHKHCDYKPAYGYIFEICLEDA